MIPELSTSRRSHGPNSHPLRNNVRELEIKQLVTNSGIVLVKFIEFALLEKNDCIPELVFPR
jgi:hypothetical protein